MRKFVVDVRNPNEPLSTVDFEVMAENIDDAEAMAEGLYRKYYSDRIGPTGVLWSKALRMGPVQRPEQQEVQVTITMTLSADLDADLDFLRRDLADGIARSFHTRRKVTLIKPMDVEVREEAEIYGNE